MKSDYSFFQLEKCQLCGECLSRCVYLKLSRSEALREKERLNKGLASKIVNKSCVSCYACNAFCPNDCHPYEQITSHWFRRYQEKGLPYAALYMLPYQIPNFRTAAVSYFSPPEKELLHQIETADPTGQEVIYPGCNLLVTPYLLKSAIFSEVTLAGRFDLCCGEMYFRMGLFDQVAGIARRLTNYYHAHPPKRMIFPCPACYNMFKNVLPQQFTAQFDFEMRSLADWFSEKLDQGRFEIHSPLKRTITLFDSCNARILGKKFMRQERELLSRIGLKIKEMPNSMENGLCCGIAAGCNSCDPIDIARATLKAIAAIQQGGIKEVGFYCTGCLLNISTLISIAELFPRSPVFDGISGLSQFRDFDFHHTLEYLAMAIGDPLETIHIKRAQQILWGVLKNAVPRLLFPLREKLAQISEK